MERVRQRAGVPIHRLENGPACNRRISTQRPEPAADERIEGRTEVRGRPGAGLVAAIFSRQFSKIWIELRGRGEKVIHIPAAYTACHRGEVITGAPKLPVSVSVALKDSGVERSP